MPAPLADSLLALAASIDGDGGLAVCRTLAALLREAAPFDAGEVVLRQAEGLLRFPFARHDQPVAGDDLVNHVLASAAPRRLDDQRDLDAFPETGRLMALGGLKSALVLPLGSLPFVPGPHPTPSSGVLIVARRHGWAFVGASLHFLGPLSLMAGLALDRSLALTALGHPAGVDADADADQRDLLRREGATLIGELQRLRSESALSASETLSLRSALAVARDELADARGATIAAQSALDQAVGRCHELQAKLDRGDPGAGRQPTLGAVADEGMVTDGAAVTDGAPTVSVEEALPIAVASGTQIPLSGIITGEPEVVAPPPPAPASSRRGRRRRRGAFEPPGGPGA
jgi:hypothetical protein